MKTDNKINYEEKDLKKSMKVPEHYFEDFAKSLEEKIGVQPVSVKQIMRPWMYMAAMFLVVAFVAQVAYTVFFEPSKKSNYTETAFVTDKDKYELYVDSQIDDNVFYEYLMEEGDNSIE